MTFDIAIPILGSNKSNQLIISSSIIGTTTLRICRPKSQTQFHINLDKLFRKKSNIFMFCLCKQYPLQLRVCTEVYKLSITHKPTLWHGQ